MKKITVIDCTLKQDYCKSLSFREKTNIAKNIESFCPDIIELPALRDKKEDEIVVKTISSVITKTAVLINAGVTEEEITRAFGAVKSAKEVWLQIALPVSTVQMEYMYHLKAAAMLEKISALCSFAAKTGAKVEFKALDASRAEAGFLAEASVAAVKAGANAVTVCDDAGVFMPEDAANAVKELVEAIDVPVFVEVSDSLKMGAASAVYAIAAGCTGVKTSLFSQTMISPEVIAEIFRAKGDVLGVCSNLDITAISSIVGNISSATAVDSKATGDEQVVTALSGKSSFAEVSEAVTALGYDLSSEENGRVYEEFSRVCAKKTTVSLKELEAIVATSAMQVPSTYHLDNHVVTSGSAISAMANITLIRNGERIAAASIGEGPIDASFKAIEQIIGYHYELDDFQIQSVTEGREAVGHALVRLRADGKLYSGNGISTDIVSASIRAYINAINKIVYEEN